MKYLWRWLGGTLLLLALLLAGPFWLLATEQVALDRHWSSADRTPAGLAPEPHRDAPAVVQVYAARAFHWRGAFAVHTWIATKGEGDRHYRLHHVLSWRRPTVISGIDNPDRAWFGNPPELLADYRGEAAGQLIPLIEAAVSDYPNPDQYRAWPGPNSNSFVAWIIREVPGLDATLPVTAIGKDYLFDGVTAPAPSGTGYQLALAGLFGITLARDEGIELTLLGLSLGIDIFRPALKLPGIERIGMPALIKGTQ